MISRLSEYKISTRFIVLYLEKRYISEKSNLFMKNLIEALKILNKYACEGVAPFAGNTYFLFIEVDPAEVSAEDKSKLEDLDVLPDYKCFSLRYWPEGESPRSFLN